MKALDYKVDENDILTNINEIIINHFLHIVINA